VTHIVKEDNSIIALKRRNDVPPHILIAPIPVREHHGTAALPEDTDIISPEIVQ
jgi:hypothetical protein